MPSNLLNNKTTQQEQQRNKNNNKIIRMKKNGSNKHNNKQETTTNKKQQQTTRTRTRNNQQQPNMPTSIKVKQFLQISTTISTKIPFQTKKTSRDQPICSARGSTLFGAFTSAWKPKALPSMPGFKDPLTLNVSSWCRGNIRRIGVLLTE